MPSPHRYVLSQLRQTLRLIAVFALPVLLPAQTPARIPVEAFFAEPDVRQVQLSPDGKSLAFLTTLGTGKVGIALMHLETGKIEPLVAATDENIKSYLWKGNDYIVYGGDLGGNESSALRSISLSKRKVVALADSYDERAADRANWANVADPLRFEPNFMLVSGPSRAGSSTFGFWRLDVRNGERRSVGSYEPKTDTQDLAIDNKGVIRGRSYLLGEKIIFEVRPEPDSGFVKVAEFPANDPKWSFGAFAADNETLNPGDSASYRADVPHAIVNTGKGEAVIFLVDIYR